MNEETKTLELNDFQVEKLYNGYSININKTIITFALGSKRRLE